MKLDIDRLTKSIVQFILTIPYPFKIRISASGEGCHIVKDCSGCQPGAKCLDCWVRTQYDDKTRLRWDSVQYKNSLINNVLWNTKKGGEANDWIIIKDYVTRECFLRDHARLLRR